MPFTAVLNTIQICRKSLENNHYHAYEGTVLYIPVFCLTGPTNNIKQRKSLLWKEECQVIALSNIFQAWTVTLKGRKYKLCKKGNSKRLFVISISFKRKGVCGYSNTFLRTFSLSFTTFFPHPTHIGLPVVVATVN